MTEMNGKVALITGVSSGIGWATGEALAARGVKVVHAARRLEGIRLAMLMEKSAVQREMDLNALLRAAAGCCCARGDVRWAAQTGGGDHLCRDGSADRQRHRLPLGVSR